MTQGKLYQKLEQAVQNKTIDHYEKINDADIKVPVWCIKISQVLDEAKADLFKSACQNCSYGCTASPGEKNCIYNTLTKWFGESP